MIKSTDPWCLVSHIHDLKPLDCFILACLKDRSANLKPINQCPDSEQGVEMISKRCWDLIRLMRMLAVVCDI